MNSFNFKNQVAIVTGAGQGIGYEVCYQLAAAGATVILNDIEKTLADEAAAKIRAAGGDCHSYAADVADPMAVKTMVKYAAEKFGRLDIAIANAGITLFSEFFEYTPESFFNVMNVNLGGSFFLAQAAANQMKVQQGGGRILFTSSVVGHQAHRNLAAYAMTKAAVEMLARNLVVELSPFNITVNAVAPGATLTERTENDPDYPEIWSRITPLGKPASTSDVAQAMLFMVSAAAGHITGQTLIVDGGWTCVSVSPYEKK